MKHMSNEETIIALLKEILNELKTINRSLENINSFQ